MLYVNKYPKVIGVINQLCYPGGGPLYSVIGYIIILIFMGIHRFAGNP